MGPRPACRGGAGPVAGRAVPGRLLTRRAEAVLAHLPEHIAERELAVLRRERGLPAETVAGRVAEEGGAVIERFLGIRMAAAPLAGGQWRIEVG